jgi:hypothetical protein
MQHFRPHLVDDCEGNLGSVVRRINVEAERALSTCWLRSATLPLLFSDGNFRMRRHPGAIRFSPTKAG